MFGQVWTNSVNPDQTAPWEQSDQGLHCLPFGRMWLNHIIQILG